MTATWLEAAAAEFEPPQDDAFALLGYEPICLPRHEALKRGDLVLPEPCGNCPQELFHAATEDDVLYGGAAGGGKTIAIVAEALRACKQYPGIRVLIIRRSYDELAESIYPEFQRFAWGEALGGRWNKTEKEVTFPNHSLIRLRYMETLDDASRRQGGAYQLMFVDERTLLAPGIVDVVALERLRSAHGVPVIGIRSTSNPGGPGHGEVRSRYIDPTEHGRKIVTNDHGLTVRFIPAKATDNPHLDEAYFRRLDTIPDPARRAAMRDGDWGQFAGQMFPELRWDRHTVDPFALPASWRRYSVVDWGYTNPWAVLWGAVDEDGRAWAYREIYETQVGEAEQARRILAAEAEGERITARIADDAMWALRGDAKPISQVYAENGVHLLPAGKGPGSRVSGWQRVHSYLAEGPACLIHRAMGWETCPMIHFFRTLPKMWWELSNLPHARKGDPEDADSSAPDHLCDTLRYWLLNMGSGAEAWLDWARRKAEEAAAARGEGRVPEPRPSRTRRPETAPEPELEPGLALTPEQVRKAARDAAFRAAMRLPAPPLAAERPGDAEPAAPSGPDPGRSPDAALAERSGQAETEGSQVQALAYAGASSHGSP